MSSETLNGNPYPGPRPFQTEEEKIFFGRERESREIVSLVFAHRVLFLYAQSGAGKTSLLNASLVPSLKREGFDVLPIVRVGAPIPEKDIDINNVRNVFVFNTLMACKSGGANPNSLLSTTIPDFLNRRARMLDEQDKPLPCVIIFDQFEELLTSYQERWTERASFFSQLAEAIKNDRQLRVIFVLREDYLAGLDPYADLLPERPAMRMRLERLRAESARLAVELPLENTARRFAKGVAESLVEQLLTVRSMDAERQVRETKGEFVEPVQLQVVCATLWDDLPPEVVEITHEHLQTFGDVNEALSEFYNTSIGKALKEADVSEADLRNWFEQTLITPAGTRGSVFMGEDKTGGIPNRVVFKLEELHLVRGESRAGARWYELTHDRFIEPIIESNKDWRLKRPQAEQAHQALEEKANLWMRGGRGLLDEVELREAERWLSTPEAARISASPALRALLRASQTEADSLKLEEQKRRLAEKERDAARLRRLVAALICVFFMAVAAAAFAFVQKGRADKALKEAERLREVAEERREAAEKSREAAEKSAAAAIVEGDKAEKAARLAEAERAKAEDATEKERAANQKLDAQRQEALRQKALADAERIKAQEQEKIARYETQNAQTARQEVEQLQKLTSARLLGVQADSIGTFRPDLTQLSLLLGVESAKIAPNPEADRALSYGVAALPRRAGPSMDYSEDHKSSAYQPVALSKDGKYLATSFTGGALNTSGVKVWGIDKHEPIASLPSKYQIMRIEFSRDGKYLLYKEKNSHVYDIEGRRELLNEELHSAETLQDVSPDGKYLGSTDDGGIIRIRDLRTKQVVATFDHEGNVTDLVYSPNGRIFATIEQRFVRLWKSQENTELASIEHDSYVTSMVFSPDGKHLATTSAVGSSLAAPNPKYEVRILDTETGKLVNSIPQTDSVSRMIFSPDGENLAVCGSSDVKIWKVLSTQESGPEKEEASLPHQNYISHLAFSPDGEYLATVSSDITKVWKWKEENEITLIERESALQSGGNSLIAIAFSPDGANLITARKNNTSVWRALGSPPDVKVSSVNKIGYLDSTRDGKYFLSISEEGIAMRETSTGKEISAIKPEGEIQFVSLSPDGHYLAIGAEEFDIWDMQSRKKVAKMQAAGFFLPLSLRSVQLLKHTAVLFSPDGKRIAMVDNEDIKVLKLPEGQEVARFKYVNPGERASSLFLFADFTQDGKYIVIYDGDELRIWETLTGRIIGKVTEETDSKEPSLPIISPDGKYITFSLDGKAISILEMPGLRLVSRLKATDEFQIPVSFSQDGRRLATLTNEVIRVWDAATGEEVPSMKQDLGPMIKVLEPLDKKTTSDLRYNFSISDGGKFVSTIINGKFVRVWEVATGESFQADIVPSDQVVVTPDGKHVIGINVDKGSIGIWRLRSLDLATEACERLTRNLTKEEWRKYIRNDAATGKTCPNLQ